MGQILATPGFRPSEFRKLAKETRLQILEHIVDDCQPEPRSSAEFRDAPNTVPPLIVALRGHHDRELYFEALEVFYQRTRFQLNERNAYGGKVPEHILLKVRKIELFVKSCLLNTYGGQMSTITSSYRRLQKALNAEDIQVKYLRFGPKSELEFMSAMIASEKINRFIVLRGDRQYGGVLFDAYDRTLLNAWFGIRGQQLWSNSNGDAAWVWERKDSSHLTISDRNYLNILNLLEWVEIHHHIESRGRIHDHIDSRGRRHGGGHGMIE